MFFKLLLKILKRLSPDKKNLVRGVLDDNAKEVIENNKSAKSMKTQAKLRRKQEKRRKNKMAETEKDKSTPKVDETKEETKTTETVDETEKKTPKGTEEVEDETKKETKDEDKTETDDKESEENENSQNGVVENESNGGEMANAIPVEQLVTIDMLNERFEALSAKFDAVVKENQDLKERIGKYENEDFGNVQKQGIPEKDKQANEDFYDTFESYSARFI